MLSVMVTARCGGSALGGGCVLGGGTLGDTRGGRAMGGAEQWPGHDGMEAELRRSCSRG